MASSNSLEHMMSPATAYGLELQSSQVGISFTSLKGEITCKE